MASSPVFSSMYLSFLLVLHVMTSRTASAEACPVRNCSHSGPEIRFPFRIRDVQGQHCGYEGFEVSCDDRSRTILHLCEGGYFVVDDIDYPNQYILLKDPEDCLPKRLLEDPFLSFSLPFVAGDYEQLWLANCSSTNFSMIGAESSVVRLDCLSLAAQTAVVMVTDLDAAAPWMLQHQCYVYDISSPSRWQHPTNITESMWLRWLDPNCTACEAAKMGCGLKGSTWDLKVVCKRRDGLSHATRFAIASLFMLPWFTCICGCIWFLKVRVFVRRRLDQIDANSSFPGSALDNVDWDAAQAARRDAAGAMGISTPIIESYPKARIDDLGQLPRPHDDVCVICLSKYERSETIRTIPECGHYFHLYCIGQWLRKNGSCPLCRNYEGQPKSEDTSN